MAQALAHRGPDGRGIVVEGRVGLAHARLAVIDRLGGAQPFSNPARGTTIVYNGEVFNHVELRRELESEGRTFSTRSDTEVVLAAYEVWGDDAWRRFEGQFALALWDRLARSMHLVRDRAGICPLFVARLPNALVFGSEAKAIFASGRVEPRVDLGSINAVFRNWSVPGTRSVFEGVECIAPGQCARFALDAIGSRAWRLERQTALDRGSRAAVGRTYARLRDAVGETTVAATTAARTSSSAECPGSESCIAERLRHAVRRRLRADVPVGAYLSGGLDSSLLTALMVDESARMGVGPPTTFSIRFHGEDDAEDGFDEGAAQHAVAKALGTRHREITVGTDRLVETLGRTVDHAETPLLRAGPIPMLLLSGFVRDEGMRVVLTGEGADELFGGYDIFKEARLRAYLARDPGSAMRQALASRLHRQHARRTDGGIAMWSAFLRAGDPHGSARGRKDAGAGVRSCGSRDQTGRDADPFASHMLRWQGGAWMVRFLSRDVRASFDQEALQGTIEPAMPARWRALDDLGRAQELEIASFMVPYLLSSQGDRMLMANGVEGRYPFLDGALAAEAAKLRSEERLVGLREKPLLRRIARRLLPREIAERPKWPYRSPIQRAFFGVQAPESVREALSEARLRAHPLIDGPAATRLAQRAFTASEAQPLSEREEMAAFGLLTLVLWHERFIERATSAIAVGRRGGEISISEHDACACSEECPACTENER
jgi:asparagine synthase (glutamine-hydrolysing)